MKGRFIYYRNKEKISEYRGKNFIILCIGKKFLPNSLKSKENKVIKGFL